MKKILLILILLGFKQINAQTYVTIPDTAFVSWLKTNIPSAMSGNQLDITNSIVTTTYTMDVQQKGIVDLTGVQYFSSLTHLYCGSNPLTGLPVLPNSLIYIECGFSNISSITALPSSLQQLYCESNPLKTLSGLPSALTYLDCNTDSLTSLPTLPSSLTTLVCRSNQITSLPTLPSGLGGLDCGYNQLTSLPALPSGLGGLTCNNNQLTNLPTLPSSLGNLSCSSNSLTSIPALPSALRYLYCDHNNLTGLPALPAGFYILDCSHNQITSLPSFPSSMTTLSCQNNSLTSLPTLPVALIDLDCSNNNITCFAPFYTNMFSAVIGGNPFTCLPNYIGALSIDTTLYPLCGPGNLNNCPVVDTCVPNLTFLLSKDSFSLSSWTIHPIYSNNSINAVWYWGDGTSSSGFYPSHVYASPGSYNICATAFSACGDSSSTCKSDSLYRLIYNSTNSVNNAVYVNVVNGTDSTSGIKNSGNEKLQLTISPNPANGIFSLKMTGVQNNTGALVTIDIINTIGQTVYHSDQNELNGEMIKEINVQSFASGTYFVKVNTGNSFSTLKLLLNK